MLKSFLFRIASLILCCGFGLAASSVQGDTSEFQSSAKISSPDGRLVAQVGISSGGRLAWEVFRSNKLILAPSPLGLIIDDHDLGLGVKLGDPSRRSLQETYPLPGWHDIATNHLNEAVFPVTQPTGGQSYNLVVRVFDDGAAVRYEVPLQGAHRLNGEATAWQFATDAQAWWSPFDPSYEELFRGSSFGEIPEGKPIETPVTLQPRGGKLYVAISEADCEDYPDMALRREGTLLRPDFWASEKGWEVSGPVTSPWRVVIVAADLTALVNSDIIANLNPSPEPELANADWIQPGRVLWQWYSSDSPKFAEQPAWFDAAAKLGWEYYLIDDGWRTWRADGKDQWQCLKEVIDYGNSKGVKSIVWVDSKEMRDAASRRAYLEKVKATGAAGIKIDFIPPATAEIVRWYEGALKDTAGLKLLCNFHGCIKPSGRRRTWPHELTREAVRGQEWHMTRFNRTMPLETDTIIPFTRYLQGPADYTPMVFDPAQLRGFTWPRELASAIVFTSPLMHYGDSYKQYVGNPAEDILHDLPTTWDETLVLPGTEIGKVVGFARRKGSDWYVGVMNGAQASQLNIKLDFLPAGKFDASLFFDLPGQPAAFDRRERSLTRSETLRLNLQPGGGFAARLRVSTK
ncbi:MAG: glycoside hydrolase family 97 N-terminal domain-containing protein [Verrucomicrobiales bacterium]|nr:glycoside hydrolase family 97 N-terminal domain-containing protein [Verrucomicrobiales bacterium]